MRKWRVAYYAGIAVAVLAVVGIGVYQYIVIRKQDELNRLRSVSVAGSYDSSALEPLPTVPYPQGTVEAVVVDEDTGEESTVIVDEGLINPVDFTSLWDVNYDIYAWLRIPGTPIDYPVLHHIGSFEETDMYLRRDYTGAYSVGGSIYSQAFFNQNFEDDPITVLYGHHMMGGALFGCLDSYQEEDFREANRNVYIYMPYHSYRYRVVAVVTRSNANIMYQYGGMYIDAGEGDFTDFVTDYNDQVIGTGWYDEDFAASEDNNFLILSTCCGDTSRRMIIVTVREEVL